MTIKRISLILTVCIAAFADQIFQTGQQAVTGTATKLPNLNTQNVCLKVIPAGTQVVYVGSSAAVTTSTGYPLSAGDSVCMVVNNLNQIYVVATTTGSTMSWVTTYQAIP